MEIKKIKVLIADDHLLIREGLKRILSFEEDLILVGEAENGEKVFDLLDIDKPDVLLVDFNMPVMNGIEVLKRLKDEKIDLKVIMLTVENDGKTIHEAIDIGADGYMLKDSVGEEIVEAIKTVYSGEKYIDKSLVSLLFSGFKNKARKASNILDNLSKREIEVLVRISRGLGNKEIGEQLYLSEKTIKNYATTIFRKIGVEDRVHATILSIQNNIDAYYKDKYN
jgi:DNA-binding NarL/FixJ family response regulator